MGMLQLAPSQRRNQRLGDALAFLILAIGSIFWLLPFLWMVLSSFKTLPEIYQYPPTFFPRYLMWPNYVEAWNRMPFGVFFLNSLIVTISVVIGQLFTCSLGGYGFARLRFPGRDFLFLGYIATMMVPFAVIMIPLFILIRQIGWVNTRQALIVPALFSPWGTFLMRQFMLTLPRELEDAARIDGANYFGIYWRIILPLCRPVLATLAIFTFLGHWNDFLWPLIVINDLDLRTLPLGLAAFQAMAMIKTPWHLIMAAATFSVIPVIIVFLLGQKYYVRGIATSGLKGSA
ncbi:MAG: carbohydrate ABC transporter permease [Caldilineaceae bacterium]